MRKYIVKTPVLAGLISLLLLFPNFKKGSLTDVTKPYLGEYECTQAKLDERNYLPFFSYIKLELKKDKTFTVSYKELGGKKKELKGEYDYHSKRKVLVFKAKEGFKREIPLKDGEFSFVLPFGEKTLRLTFEQK